MISDERCPHQYSCQGMICRSGLRMVMVEMVVISGDFLSQVDNFLVDRVRIEQALGDQQLFTGLQPAFIVGARVGGARFRRGDFLNELIVPFCPAVLAIGR